MTFQLIVVAKSPVPGRVKTRLCPPCTAEQAAELALAALRDTLAAATRTSANRRVLLLDGAFPTPTGWHVQAQRGNGLAERLANGLMDTAVTGLPSLLIGMDTPQVTAAQLDQIVSSLSTSDGVLCPAVDGGWWALGLKDPRDGVALREVPMSRSDTGRLTRKALTEKGLALTQGPILRDVDTVADALAVAVRHPDTRFARTVAKQMASWTVKL